MQQPKFSKSNSSDFSKTLKKRVNEYFKTHNISKNANWNMVVKTIVMLTLFFTPLIIINTGLVTTPLFLFSLYVVSGLGMAGIGLCVMHDANHGAYSKKRKVNTILGKTMNLIGANASVWKIQHNILHHTFTNIEGADEDIDTPFVLRFSPHTKKYWINRFQHIYAWFFYGLSTIFWITTKDFGNMKHFRELGFIKSQKEYRKEMWSISGWKVLYYSYALVLPLIMVPLAWWIIVLAFIGMHFVNGILLSTVFQTAHVMPDVDYPLPDENGLIANDWTIHQMATTTNYAPNSPVLSWFMGGLNYQVEHHLLPNICHVHYKHLAPIVRETAHEYGIPYNSKPTFTAAIRDHVHMLRYLGTVEPSHQ